MSPVAGTHQEHSRSLMGMSQVPGVKEAGLFLGWGPATEIGHTRISASQVPHFLSDLQQSRGVPVTFEKGTCDNHEGYLQ